MRNLAEELVTKHINQWDPEGLLELGAPDDEYDCEIDYIVDADLDSKDEIELAGEIEYIFERMLGTRYRFDDCLSIAKAIWKDLNE